MSISFLSTVDTYKYVAIIMQLYTSIKGKKNLPFCSLKIIVNLYLFFL